ncbi:MAG TPA: hypothetical protein VMC42_08810 [Methanoregulaceae archaeon]|nr:hypothetical protein [Methanoregulaceae archaeon]
MPSAIVIFGHDNSLKTDIMLYSDDRGVARIIDLGFGDGIWKMNLSVPGFLTPVHWDIW